MRMQIRIRDPGIFLILDPGGIRERGGKIQIQDPE